MVAAGFVASVAAARVSAWAAAACVFTSRAVGLALSARAVRVGGTIVSVGFAGEGPGLDIRQIVGRAIALRGIAVGSCAMFADMNRAIAKAQLRPVIDRRFALDDVPAAYACLEAGGHVGKIVVEIADTGTGAPSGAHHEGREP